MDLAHFRMLIHEFSNKDTYIVPEEAPLIVLDIKSVISMANNVKDIKQGKKHSKENAFCKEWRKAQDAQD